MVSYRDGSNTTQEVRALHREEDCGDLLWRSR